MNIFVYSSDADTSPPWPDVFTNPLSSPHPILDMSIYGAEQRVYLAALASPCRTLAPEAADFFFVPVFSSIPVHAGLYQEEGAVANLTAGHDLLELARAALLAASPAYRADPSRCVHGVSTVSHDIGQTLT